MVYVADSHHHPTDRLRVIDVSDPTAPREIGSLDGLTNALFVDGSRLYRSTECEYDTPPDQGVRACFQVVDVSDPTQPRPLGSTRLHISEFVDGQILNHYAIVSTYADLLVFDASDPTRPSEVASYRYRGSVSGGQPRLRIAGGRAWVTAASGIQVVDVSDPLQMRHVAMYPFEDRAWDIALGRAAFVAGSGLWVFDWPR